jgi:hypothetical protein
MGPRPVWSGALSGEHGTASGAFSVSSHSEDSFSCCFSVLSGLSNYVYYAEVLVCTGPSWGVCRQIGRQFPCSFHAGVNLEITRIGPPSWVPFVRHEAVLLETWGN